MLFRSANNYVYVEWGPLFSRFHARAFPNAPPPVLRTNMSTTALEFIRARRGSAFLPRSQLQASSKPRLYEVKDAARFERTVNAIFRVNSDRVELVREIVEQLQGVEL